MDDALISTAELATRLDDPRMKVLDATYCMPGAVPTARECYEAGHLPGALFFDIDAVADRSTDLPHMLPDQPTFAREIDELGITAGDAIVVYDRPGLMSAGRVWWTLRWFGHPDVAVLDGGFRRWSAEGRSVQKGSIARPGGGTFKPVPGMGQVRSRADMLRNLRSGVAQVIDARPKGRFDGTSPESWPGRRSGHIPNSLNLPSDLLTDAETGILRPKPELRRLFEEAGLDFTRPVIATCGSGVTACALAFALHLLGKDDVAVYDGSWAEWGLPGETPVDSVSAEPLPS